MTAGPQEQARREGSTDGRAATIARLTGLLEAGRLLREGEDLERLLPAVAATISESMGLGTVVISLYRPAFDDFLVSTVHGSDDARQALLGTSRTLEQWTPLLDPAFERHGCYFLPWDEFDWSQDETPSYVPEFEPVDDPEAWHPEDALFVPLRHHLGGLLGFLSVDEPASGRRPSDEELRVLSALAAHAAEAVQDALDLAEATRHRTSLEHILTVSARLTGTTELEPILQAVCTGIRTALGFQNVSVELIEPGADTAVPKAAVGWSLQELADSPGADPALLERVLVEEFEVEGCYLVPGGEACRRLGIAQPAYRSTRNGRGPRAWIHHWLVIPLHRADGSRLGFIWADEPEDRLLPSRPRLQALRLFANQATAAVVTARAVEELRFLAEHDPLTRLGNRRAFTGRLEEESYRASRYGQPFALVLLDLDDFKVLNDRHGHAAGDAALVAVAEVLQHVLRRSDQAFRLGGDEFALLLDRSGRAEASRTIERVREALAALDLDGVAPPGASFGIALGGPGTLDPETLLRDADDALYAAKREVGAAR